MCLPYQTLVVEGNQIFTKFSQQNVDLKFVGLNSWNALLFTLKSHPKMIILFSVFSGGSALNYSQLLHVHQLTCKLVVSVFSAISALNYSQLLHVHQLTSQLAVSVFVLA